MTFTPGLDENSLKECENVMLGPVDLPIEESLVF